LKLIRLVLWCTVFRYGYRGTMCLHPFVYIADCWSLHGFCSINRCQTHVLWRHQCCFAISS